METGEIDKIIKRYNDDPQEIMAIFMEIQKKKVIFPKKFLFIWLKTFNCLLHALSPGNFYEAFNLKPQGDHHNVCMGTACHVRGARKGYTKAIAGD